jgi:hypothetical protein
MSVTSLREDPHVRFENIKTKYNFDFSDSESLESVDQDQKAQFKLSATKLGGGPQTPGSSFYP